MSDRPTIAALLREAADVHHRVYRIVDGADDDWASWYADWLLDLSELPQVLGCKPVRSHLVHALVQLEGEYSADAVTAPWDEYYADGLRRAFPPA